jgi:hypothetical protein
MKSLSITEKISLSLVLVFIIFGVIIHFSSEELRLFGVLSLKFPHSWEKVASEELDFMRGEVEKILESNDIDSDGYEVAGYRIPGNDRLEAVFSCSIQPLDPGIVSIKEVLAYKREMLYASNWSSSMNPGNDSKLITVNGIEMIEDELTIPSMNFKGMTYSLTIPKYPGMLVNLDFGCPAPEFSKYRKQFEKIIRTINLRDE